MEGHAGHVRKCVTYLPARKHIYISRCFLFCQSLIFVGWPKITKQRRKRKCLVKNTQVIVYTVCMAMHQRVDLACMLFMKH